MRRRDLIAGVAALTVAGNPSTLFAQLSSRMRTIGILMSQVSERHGAGGAMLAALRDQMKKLDWVEGRNLRLEVRWTASKPELVDRYAAELVALQPDVLMSSGAPLLAALQRATSTIPIVFVFVSNPLALGLVKDLARPGGNATGFTGFEPSLGGKWIELMKELAPNTRQVTMLHTSKGAPSAAAFRKFAEEAATLTNVRCVTRVVDGDDMKFAPIIEELAREPGNAIIMIPDTITSARLNEIVPAALQFRIPLISPFPSFAQAGALAAYGVSSPDSMRRAASYVDRILRGERPGDLPVQEPTQFEMIINLKTAKSLGLQVSPSLLARADEVIE